MRTLKLITRFYSGFFSVNFLISLACAAIMRVYKDHSIEIVGILFWFKVITIGVMFYATIFYKEKELYYYQNLGISKIKLGVATSTFDFLLWLALILIAQR